MNNKLSKTAYRFQLELGELVEIGGIEYRYDGDGHLRGSIDPKLARELAADKKSDTN